MTTHVTPDRETLYHAIRDRYTEVALNPEHTFHFHHGRPLAEILGYPMDQVDALPPQAVESFSGVGNPFGLGPVQSGETLLDLGSGGGFDCFIAGQAVGPTGQVNSGETLLDLGSGGGIDCFIAAQADGPTGQFI